MYKQAVGPKAEGAAQAAAVAVARVVEPRVQAGLDAQCRMLASSNAARLRTVGRRLVISAPLSGSASVRSRRKRALRHDGEAGALSVEVAHNVVNDERARHRLAFFQIGPAQGRRIFQVVKKGEPGSGTWVCTAAWRQGWLALTVST